MQQNSWGLPFPSYAAKGMCEYRESSALKSNIVPPLENPAGNPAELSVSA
jgi:hypothetical protein